MPPFTFTAFPASRRTRALLVVAALLVGCRHPPARERREEPPARAQLVTFRALDGVALHGFLYLPEGAAPFPAVLWNHGSEKWPGWQAELADFYTSHGYAFFLPHRRGQGRSSDAGAYIGDRQPATFQFAVNGTNAGKTMIALHEEASRDVEAAIAWLKARPEIDPGRLVMSGVSYGGIQTLLAAEKGLGVRAFAAFAPGAMSWRWVTGLDGRLEQAVRNAQAPVLIVQAQNDFSLAPSQTLGPLLERDHKGRAVVFPAFGSTEQEGHGRFARSPEGAAIWGPTVLAFFGSALPGK
jgi:carboxymethylenebutenolidase